VLLVPLLHACLLLSMLRVCYWDQTRCLGVLLQHLIIALQTWLPAAPCQPAAEEYKARREEEQLAAPSETAACPLPLFVMSLLLPGK
jgi:hypothetical protein